VPVHADIPHQEVVFLDETDPVSSPMKAKGMSASWASAAFRRRGGERRCYNATGVRVRDYPITLDKLIGKLPASEA
jgi:xanthine dehydrogenase YagR molybdenum-binding subunit